MATNNQNIGIVCPVPMGDWQTNVPYQKLNMVRSHNATYIAKKDNSGVEPTVTQGWAEVWQVIAFDGGQVSPDGNYPQMSVGQATNDSTGQNIAQSIQSIREDIQKFDILNYLFPIGSHYIQFNTEATPAAKFGGTWQVDTAYSGRVLVGSGTGFTIGATGGEESHMLSKEEIPDHYHNGYIIGDQSSLTDNIAVSTQWGKYQTIGDFAKGIQDYPGQSSLNLMQPYKVVTIWKRTA